MEWLKWLSALGLLATIFAQVTTGLKNIKDLRAKQKRRPPQKKRRK